MSDACEAEKAKRAEERKEKLVKAGKKIAEPAADVAVDAMKIAAVKHVKKAVPVAGKAVKKAIVGH